MDNPDCFDIILSDAVRQEYLIATNKGLQCITLDEECNIIDRFESYFKDKDIRCIAKISTDTIIFAIRSHKDL
jgi:hypothetical protein